MDAYGVAFAVVDYEVIDSGFHEVRWLEKGRFGVSQSVGVILLSDYRLTPLEYSVKWLVRPMFQFW